MTISRTTMIAEANAIKNETAPRANTAARVGGAVRDMVDYVDGSAAPQCGAPWIEAAAHDSKNTSATTANQTVGDFSVIPGGLGGADCIGAGQLVIAVRDSGEGADLEIQIVSFTFKVVAGSGIVISSNLLSGTTARGAVTVAASGAGFKAQATPNLSTPYRWDSALKIIGRLT